MKYKLDIDYFLDQLDPDCIHKNEIKERLKTSLQDKMYLWSTSRLNYYFNLSVDCARVLHIDIEPDSNKRLESFINELVRCGYSHLFKRVDKCYEI